MAKISILGAGGWGTAVAILTANQGHKVSLWARSEASADELRSDRINRHLPGVVIPEEVQITNQLNPASDADCVFWAMPSTPLSEFPYTVPRSIPFPPATALISF